MAGCQLSLIVLFAYTLTHWRGETFLSRNRVAIHSKHQQLRLNNCADGFAALRKERERSTSIRGLSALPYLGHNDSASQVELLTLRWHARAGEMWVSLSLKTISIPGLQMLCTRILQHQRPSTFTNNKHATRGGESQSPLLQVTNTSNDFFKKENRASYLLFVYYFYLQKVSINFLFPYGILLWNHFFSVLICVQKKSTVFSKEQIFHKSICCW